MRLREGSQGACGASSCETHHLSSQPDKADGGDGDKTSRVSNQPQPLQTRMPVLPDDDVIVHRDAEGPCHAHDLLRHRNICLRRRRIAARMIVHQNDGRRAQLERALDHLARIDRGVINGALLPQLVGYQARITYGDAGMHGVVTAAKSCG
jgi:hypothetical protein